MDIKSTHIDIVLLAETHNPSIISPEWVKATLLITEEHKNFVHTPPLSMFESESFLLIVDQNRLQITAKKRNDEKILKSLPEIAKAYVTSLPHIPYKALGFNFIWVVQPLEKEKPLNVQLHLDGIDLTKIITDHEINYGGIIYAKKSSYLLRITIERQDKGILMYNFNYHYEIKGATINDIHKFIESFIESYNNSHNIIQKIYHK